MTDTYTKDEFERERVALRGALIDFLNERDAKVAVSIAAMVELAAYLLSDMTKNNADLVKGIAATQAAFEKAARAFREGMDGFSHSKH